MKNSNKGFTLIELLVVIAIIGILSSVVLASLTSARNKGSDAAVQSTLSNMRAQAELYYATTGNYGTTSNTALKSCGFSMFSSTSTPTGIGKMVDSLTTLKATNIDCFVDSTTASTKWTVDALLPSGLINWCVDSTGKSASSTASSLSDSCI